MIDLLLANNKNKQYEFVRINAIIFKVLLHLTKKLCDWGDSVILSSILISEPILINFSIYVGKYIFLLKSNLIKTLCI